jgi:hypothetical protein
MEEEFQRQLKETLQQYDQNNQAETNSQPMTNNYQFPPPELGKKQIKKTKHGLILLVAAAIIVVITTVPAVLLATRTWDPLWSPFRPEPTKIIFDAFKQLKEIKSERFSFETSVIGKNLKDVGDAQFLIKASGAIDLSQKDNPLSDITFSFSTKAAKKYDNFLLSAQSKVIDDKMYLILSDYNFGEFEMFLAMFGINLNKLKGQWVLFETKNFSQNLSADIISTQEQDEKITKAKEAYNKLLNLFLKKNVFNIKEMPDQNSQYHYIISINKIAANQISPEIYSILNDSFPDTNAPTQEEFIKKFSKFLDTIEGASANLFVGKKDGFFHKIWLSKEISLSDYNDAKYTGILNINMQLEGSNFNEKIEITAPADYKNFKDMLQESSERLFQQTNKTNKSTKK